MDGPELAIFNFDVMMELAEQLVEKDCEASDCHCCDLVTRKSFTVEEHDKWHEYCKLKYVREAQEKILRGKKKES